MTKVVIMIFLLGMATAYLRAIDHTTGWAWFYYIWDKTAGGGFLTWFCIYKLYYRKNVVLPIVVFTFIRFIWEIVSACTGVNVNNSIAIAVLFLVLVIVTGYLVLDEKGKASLWLTKHLKI